MTLQSFAWICALLCFSMVQCLPLKCQLDATLLQTSHSLLKDMGGKFPPQCIKENTFISFPTSAFMSNGTLEQSGDVETALYQTLHSINSLFENDNFPAEWDPKKLDDFLNIIYRQAETNKCATGGKPDSGDRDISNRMETLKMYFQKLASVLQEKNFRFCAWEIVRKEVMRTLQFILENNSSNLRWPRRV